MHMLVTLAFYQPATTRATHPSPRKARGGPRVPWGVAVPTLVLTAWSRTNSLSSSTVTLYQPATTRATHPSPRKARGGPRVPWGVAVPTLVRPRGHELIPFLLPLFHWPCI